MVILALTRVVTVTTSLAGSGSWLPLPNDTRAVLVIGPAVTGAVTTLLGAGVAATAPRPDIRV